MLKALIRIILGSLVIINDYSMFSIIIIGLFKFSILIIIIGIHLGYVNR